MELHELKALCELQMVSDPYPLDESKKETIEKFLNKTANDLGFDGWIEALHYIGDY